MSKNIETTKAGERTQEVGREDVYENMSYADRAFNDRLDYANECRESGDWRDPGEIRMGA
jgi:hypothetical protein